MCCIGSYRCSARSLYNAVLMWNWVYMSLKYWTSFLCVVVTVLTSITSLRLKTICYLNSPQRFPWSAIAGLRCVCGWVGATSLLRFLCGSNSASVAVSALTPIQQSVAAVSRIGTVGLTVSELDTRVASPPLACLHKSVAAWIFYWRLHAVGHGQPRGPLQLHGWQDDGLSFSMR
jgi:hypothetical protein